MRPSDLSQHLASLRPRAEYHHVRAPVVYCRPESISRVALSRGESGQTRKEGSGKGARVVSEWCEGGVDGLPKPRPKVYEGAFTQMSSYAFLFARVTGSTINTQAREVEGNNRPPAVKNGQQAPEHTRYFYVFSMAFFRPQACCGQLRTLNELLESACTHPSD